jgi:hypothetical protein
MSTDSETYNPFADAEDWDVATERWLKEGNYIVKVVSVADESSQNGNPKLRIELEASEGIHTDYLPYSCEFTRKVATLYRRVGLTLGAGDFDPADRCRLTTACQQRLVGKRVGVVIRNEPDLTDPEKMWPRVQGYIDPARITGRKSETGLDTRGLPDMNTQAPESSGDNDDYPF